MMILTTPDSFSWGDRRGGYLVLRLTTAGMDVVGTRTFSSIQTPSVAASDTREFLTELRNWADEILRAPEAR